MKDYMSILKSFAVATKESMLYLPAIIFIEGFVTISAEMLTIRQLIPQVGNSVVVTSLIIGIFLLFLAYGYRKGGTYQDNYVEVLQDNFFKAALLIGVGLSTFFITSFFNLCLAVFYQNSFVVLLLYLFVITAPMVYLLGQTVPLTTNLYQQGKSVAIVSSRVLHLSTLGAFLGAVFTTLILMNYLGIAWTVFINFGLLFGLSVIGRYKDKSNIGLFCCIIVSLFVVNIIVEKKSFLFANNYADYKIISPFSMPAADSYSQQYLPGKLLLINSSNSSFIDAAYRAFPYIEVIKKILFSDLQLKEKDILVLGAGGFTLSAQDMHDNHFTYVDIDEALEGLVKNYYLGFINGRFIVEDARVFVAKTHQLYDVVVSDAYSNKLTIPYHLITREHLLNIRRVLRDSGVAIFNVVAKPTLEDPYSKRIDSTLRSVFSNCVVIPERYSTSITNMIYVCKKSPLEQDKRVYTDNLNSATLDYFRWNSEG
jgi:predicted membrane-bound spermidine synthase